MKPAPTAKPGAPPVAESGLDFIFSRIPPHKKTVTVAYFTAPGQEPLYPIVFEQKRMSGAGHYGFPCGSIDELLDPSAEACAKRALLEQCFDAPVINLLKGLGHGIHSLHGIDSLRIEFSASLRGRTVRTPDEIRANIIAARTELVKARTRTPKYLIDKIELEPLLQELREELKDAKASAGTTARTVEEISADIVATEAELTEVRNRRPAMSEKNLLGNFTVKNNRGGSDLYFTVFAVELPMELSETVHPGREQMEVQLATRNKIRDMIGKGRFFPNQTRVWEVFTRLQNYAATAPAALPAAAKPSAPAVAASGSQLRPAATRAPVAKPLPPLVPQVKPGKPLPARPLSLVRINELARELAVKAKAIIDLLPEYGVTEKKTHSSSIPVDVAEKVRNHFCELAAVEAVLEAATRAAAAAEAAAAEEAAKEAAAKVLRMPGARWLPNPAKLTAKSYMDIAIENLNHLERAALFHPRLVYLGVSSELEVTFRDIAPSVVKSRAASKDLRDPHRETTATRDLLRECAQDDWMPEDLKCLLAQLFKKDNTCRHARAQVTFDEAKHAIKHAINFLKELSTSSYQDWFFCSTCKESRPYDLGTVLGAAPGEVVYQECSVCHSYLEEGYTVPSPREAVALPNVDKWGSDAITWLTTELDALIKYRDRKFADLTEYQLERRAYWTKQRLFEIIVQNRPTKNGA